MGYACPVCGSEEADGVHLANHLAVTASLGRTEHVEWLEAHAPDWGESTPTELADVVVEYAPEVETPAFSGASESAASGHDQDHGNAHGHDHDHHSDRAPSFEAELAAQTRGAGRGELSGDAATVLAEARALTREMYGEGDEAEGGAEDEPDRERNG